MYIIKYPDQLIHYGVKGMRWGVRKDKYANRNLRAAAKSRRDAAELKKAGYHEEAKAVYKVAKKQQKKGERKLAKKQARKESRDASISKFRNLTGSRKSVALKEARKKDINKMSNQELQDTITRLNLERSYRSLTKADYMRGQKYASDMLKYESTYTAASNSKTTKKLKKAYAVARISAHLATATP